MGQGIDLGCNGNKELAKAMEDLRDQVLIELVRKAGGKVTIPVSNIDDTGKYIMEMIVDQANQTFTFIVKKKQ